MLRITCKTEPATDGGYRLTAGPSWRFTHERTLVLRDREADLWSTLCELASFPPEVQRQMVQALPTASRSNLLRGASILQKSGFLTLDSSYQPAEAQAPGMRKLGKLHLELTYRCNYACRACYLGPRLLRPGDRTAREGTTEQWLRLIDEAGTLGCSFATVTGGEPFLRKDALEILRGLSRNGILAEINTNASAITPQLAGALVPLLISTVEVSLYGYDSPSTTAYTGNPSAFAATLRGVRHLVEREIPVRVKFFATHETISGFAEAERQLAELGVKPTLIGHSIHGDVFNGALPAQGLSADDLPRPPLVQETELPCAPGIQGLGIEPDGLIRACPKLTIYFGNAFEDGLATVWQRSTDLEAFRTFWVRYCKSAGYVRGRDNGSLCPATPILSRPGGLADFRALWQSWQAGQGG